MPFSLIVNASRASRHASRASAAARGLSTSARLVGVQRRRGRRDDVPIDRLDRSDTFEQEIDARPPQLALVSLVDPPPHALRVTVRVAVPLHLGVELGQFLRVAARDFVGGAGDRGIELFRDRERGRAGAVQATGGVREQGAEVGERTRRARGHARAGRPTATPRARAASADRPSRSSAARNVSSGTGSKSTRWQRDRIVGRRSSALDDTSTMTVRAGGSSSVFSSAFAATAGGTESFSASNSSSTLRSPSTGLRCASGSTFSRMSSTLYDAPPGSNSTTSGCSPRSTSRRVRSSSPAPMRSAAKVRAAASIPEPRGPTRRYAWVGRSARARARRSRVPARSRPSTSWAD